MTVGMVTVGIFTVMIKNDHWAIEMLDC